MADFGALLCVYLPISHQWGKLQHLFLFLLAHENQPVFSGYHERQNLAAKFSGSMLNVVTQCFRHFNTGKNRLLYS